MNIEYYLKDPTVGITPRRANPNAHGVDIGTSEDVDLPTNTIVLVETSLVVRSTCPNTAIKLMGRSSNAKCGFFVIEGLIDPDYCGPNDTLKIQVCNPFPYARFLPAGSIIAQLVPYQITPLSAIVPFTPTSPSRGGFGSTTPDLPFDPPIAD